MREEDKKEITIAYGREIRLTTIGDKKKEVFLKFSPAFRNKQLRELKGAPLSIFICYALHSDENGYTWIDDRTIKKETGYSITSEIRQKLIKMGYLYQERLYDKQGKFKDWIYRIFQPIEDKKEFIIKEIKQYTHILLQGKKTYLEENPIQRKNGGYYIIEEEEPIIIKEEPSTLAKANGDKVAKGKISKNFVLIFPLIEYFFSLKGWSIPAEMKQKRIRFSRWMRPASDILQLLAGDIDKAKELIKSLKIWAMVKKLDWNLSTVLKRWDDLVENKLIDDEIEKKVDETELEQVLSKYK